MKLVSDFFRPGIKSAGAYKFIILLALFILVNNTPADSELLSGISKKKLRTQIHNSFLFSKSLKKYTVSGKVTQTFPYCGGAQPTKEILERAATPVAFTNKKFYVRLGKINSLNAKIIKSFVTDSVGFFSIQLQPGTYSVILEEQLYKLKEEDYKKRNQKVDMKCLNEWWTKPYCLLKVENSNITDLKFNFQHRCFIDTDIPCIYYTGPPRP